MPPLGVSVEQTMDRGGMPPTPIIPGFQSVDRSTERNARDASTTCVGVSSLVPVAARGAGAAMAPPINAMTATTEPNLNDGSITFIENPRAGGPGLSLARRGSVKLETRVVSFR